MRLVGGAFGWMREAFSRTPVSGEIWFWHPSKVGVFTSLDLTIFENFAAALADFGFASQM